MLFAYKYVSHRMEKMQDYIDYIFYELWSKSPFRQYDIELYNGNTELQEIITAFHYSPTKGGDYFVSKIEEIYSKFKTLSTNDIEKLKRWYEANNNIEKLCVNDPSTVPVTYNELKYFDEELSGILESFFKKLYGTEILSLKPLSLKIGKIDEHYDYFMKNNNKGKCPYCGINDIKGIYHSKREAYDHYLPIGTYPFNSINFKNLAPMCNECNSSYKLAKDPLYDCKKNRRKAFYSYMSEEPEIKIELEIQNKDIANIAPEDINLKINSENYPEEVQTWKELFGIEERYKAKCTSESDGKYWFIQIQDECQNYNMTPKELLNSKITEAEKYPLFDTNSLRKPFLEACENKKLFVS